MKQNQKYFGETKKGWLWAFALVISFTFAPTSFAGGLETSIPMSNKSWTDVRSYVDTINRSYVPSPQVFFKHSQPQLVISEKTAVNVLNSVRDSLEEGGQNFEPWVFQHIDFMCGLPCDGT